MGVPQVKEAHWRTIIIFVGGSAFYILLIVEGVFRTDLFTAISRQTGGLVNPTLVSNLLATAILIGVVVLWFGTLSPSDIGLSLGNVPIGIGLTVGVWFAMQVATLLAGMVLGGTQIHPIWSEVGVWAGLGQVIGHLFGNAVYEELGFRAFLFPQIYLKLRGDWWGTNTGIRVVAALAASQGVFTILHIPIFVYNGTTGVSLIQSLVIVFIFAVFLTIVYVRTRNVFFTIGVHSLLNFSAPIVDLPGFDSSMFLFIGTVLVLIAWPWLVSEGSADVFEK